MQITINKQEVFYKQDGIGQDILILHGWGTSHELMMGIHDHLKTKFRVTTIDFPGFGESLDPLKGWTVYDYCDFVEGFIKELGLINPILIGHSFGCRISLIYATRHPELKKMILTGAAGIKPKRGLVYYYKVYTYKSLKFLLKVPFFKHYALEARQKAGSSDYQQVSGIMRETFVNVVNEDLSALLKDVKAETLLVFGEKDDATPLWMGKQMERDIPNSSLIVFEGRSHYAYLEELNRFNLICDAFLESEVK